MQYSSFYLHCHLAWLWICRILFAIDSSTRGFSILNSRSPPFHTASLLNCKSVAIFSIDRPGWGAGVGTTGCSCGCGAGNNRLWCCKHVLVVLATALQHAPVCFLNKYKWHSRCILKEINICLTTVNWVLKYVTESLFRPVLRNCYTTSSCPLH